jgi:hypothetical protein
MRPQNKSGLDGRQTNQTPSRSTQYHSNLKAINDFAIELPGFKGDVA